MQTINDLHHYFSTYPYNTDIYSSCTLPQHRFSSTSLLIEAIEFINRHFYWKSELLFVRVDLRYNQDFNDSSDLQRIQLDRDRLLSDRRNFPDLYRDYLGHMWCLEHGEQRTGYHIHLLLIYDGTKRKSAIQVVDQVEAVWKYRITNGEGEIYSPNRDSRPFINTGTLGIGVIHRADHQLRVNLIERVVAYLLKKSSVFDEQSKVTVSGQFRTFGKSAMPPPIDPSQPRIGRPPQILGNFRAP